MGRMCTMNAIAAEGSGMKTLLVVVGVLVVQVVAGLGLLRCVGEGQRQWRGEGLSRRSSSGGLVAADSVAAGLHYCSHLWGLASRVEEAW